jgi:hypothetical protein
LKICNLKKYSLIFFRYGSDLVSVESFRQNNFTADLASEFLTGQEDSSYWLGLQAYNELQTNTLSADDGHQVMSCTLASSLSFLVLKQ